ncbi:MAG: FkbM family methyltransferase [Desulfosalsimonadaceae bacterium]
MASFVKQILRSLGLNVSRLNRSPYHYLLEMERYKETIVDLLGKEFKIADSKSFYWSYQEIFIGGIYGFDCHKKKPFIIDCGSNYGTSVVFFKEQYPESRIIAVEADPKIFNLLAWNIGCREYEDITLLNKAVSIKESEVSFYREGADGGRVYPFENKREMVSVQTISLDSLIREPVDFLKMDIEGAESEVICSSEKLGDVSQIFIEYHSFTNADQTLHEILQKLSANDFRYYIHTQYCSPRPLTYAKVADGMDLKLNIFAKKNKA